MFASSALLTVCGVLFLGLTTSVAPATAINDVDILNFALNLEYLEGSFYSHAVYGKGLDASLLGGGPAPIGGVKGALSGAVADYAKEIAMDEIAHVKFLRTTLGAAAVPIPVIDIGTTFMAGANAALNTTLEPPFSPYANNLFFLIGAFGFEDVGVTAYQGAAPHIVSRDYLAAAAGILGVEAYHAGLVRTLLYEQANTLVLPYNLLVKDLVQAISNLRGLVGGGKDQGIVNSDGSPNIVPTDANSMTFARTPAEVLAIVTLGGKGGKGGFFPNGLNGNIK